MVALDQRAPLRVLIPDTPDDPLPQAILLNTAGGLVGGDRIEVSVKIGEGAAALVTAQAAEKVYRSTGRPVQIDNRIEVGSGGWFEWLPQETILFDRCRFHRTAMLDAAPDADREGVISEEARAD